MHIRILGAFVLALALGAAPADAQSGPGAAHFREGRAQLAKDHAEAAIKAFERAIAADGGVADYHYWLGAAFGVEAQRASRLRQASLGRRARDQFERALAIDPRHVAARQGLVQFYTLAPGFVGGSMAKAREHARQVMAISPYHGRLSLGQVAERSKDDAGARREYEAAIAAAPDSAGGYIALGLLHQRAKRWDDAFAAYERLLARRPAETSVLYHVGRAAALSGRQLERGEQALRRYIADPPTEATAYNVSRAHQRLAAIHERQGRTELARRHLELALKADHKNGEARDALRKLD